MELTFIKTDEIRFQYHSTFQKAANFYLKTLKKRNLKKEHQSQEILKILEAKLRQDVIMVIRPDKLEKQLLLDLKNHTSKLISYYFDGVQNLPEKIDLIPLFDEVYSYEKADVEKYDLRFITNFIPDDNFSNHKTGRGVFNISSYDERIHYLQKLALEFERLNFPYNFIVRKEKPFSCDHINMIVNYLHPTEVKELIDSSQILLDIQKGNQQGLSFRVFEALGYEKKLITTNADIVNYDFYNAQNILVLDLDNINISENFLMSPYVPVPDDIKDQYTRDTWISKVFGSQPG